MGRSESSPYRSGVADVGAAVAEERNQRRLRNKLLQPRLQLRYGAYFFVFSAAAIVLGATVVLGSAREALGRVLQQAGPEALALRGIIEDAVLTAVLQSAWLLPIFGITGLIFAILVTHRIVGPLVPIRRQIDRLAEGDYGARCRLRAGDELQGIAERLNELGDSLQRRETEASEAAPGNDAAEPRPAADEGFSIIELMVVLLLISIVGMLAVSQLIRAFDRSRQRATMADMRSMAAASETYHIDFDVYASTLSDLEPYYTQVIPPLDRWGYAWAYSGGDDYSLTSYGNDGASGPAPPSPWYDEPFEADLVVETGVFVQAPTATR